MDNSIPADLKPVKPIQTTKRDGQNMVANGDHDEQPLSPVARMFHEPGTNVYILAIIGWKTKIDVDSFKPNLERTLLRHPRFSSLQVVRKENGADIIKWVPTTVDLNQHVIIPELDLTKDTADKVVEDYIADLSISPIEMSKPMWDLHIINVKISDAESVGVLRVHHSLGDGASLMSLLLACTRKTSDPEALPTITAAKKAQSTASPNGFGYFLRRVWNTIIGVILFLLTALFLDDTKTLLKGPPGVENKRRRFVHRTVDMDDIKLVKKATDTTINDVVLGVTKAALSKYLNRRIGESNLEKGAIREKDNLPKNLRFRTTFFMNLRPAAGIYDLVDMMEKGTKARWGNEIGYVLLPLTIAMRENPLDYVKEANSLMNIKKNSLEAMGSYVIAQIVLKLFGSKAVGKISHRIFSHTTMWFSNVPGPQEEISFFGNPIAYIAPSCYGQPNALMIHVVSYRGKLTFMLSAEETNVPDPHQICDDLEDSLALMKDAVLTNQKIGKKQE